MLKPNLHYEQTGLVADQTKTPPPQENEASFEHDGEGDVAMVNKLEEGSRRPGVDKGKGKKKRGAGKEERATKHGKTLPVPRGSSLVSAKHAPVVTILAKHLNKAVELACVTRSTWSKTK